MNLSPVKREVLEHILLYDEPVRAIQVARDMGREFPSVMMHLIGLTRIGYVQSPQRGYYLITEKGKKALGLPQLNREEAITILAVVPPGREFYFYLNIGKPLNVCAQGFQDFCEKIVTVNINSVEFHVKRGDFEVWFKDLGDVELAKKVILLKNKKLSGEELRAKLAEMVNSRCVKLARTARYTNAS